MYTWHRAHIFPSETSPLSDIVITNNIYHCQTAWAAALFILEARARSSRGLSGAHRLLPERSGPQSRSQSGSQRDRRTRENRGSENGATSKQRCVYTLLTHSQSADPGVIPRSGADCSGVEPPPDARGQKQTDDAPN